MGFRFNLASRRGGDMIRERFPVVVSEVEFRGGVVRRLRLG